MTPPQWICADLAILPDGTLAPCAIAIERGLITQVLVEPDRTQLPPHTHLPHTLLSPAFVNAHTHLAMACFRGLHVEGSTQKNVVEDLFFHVESRMDDADIAAFATMGAYESLLHGVGLVWEHYYGGLSLAEGIAQTGLCAVVAPTLQDLSGPGVPQLDAQLDATLAMHSPAWSARGIWPALGPHATDTVSPALWRQICDIARQHNLPLHTHVAQSLEEVERAYTRHNCSPVALLERLGALDSSLPHHLLIHMIFASRDDLTRLDPARHTLGLCPASQLIFAFPADAPTWQELGLPFFLATDAAASNDSMNPQKELRFLAGMRTQPTSSSPAYLDFVSSGKIEDARRANAHRHAHHAERAPLADDLGLLDRLWRIPGKLHPGVQAGVIAPGALANLIAWDLHHPNIWPPDRPLRALAMGDPGAAIANLMCRGQWLGEHGDFHRSITRSSDYQDARREATSRFHHLRQRAGLSP